MRPMIFIGGSIAALALAGVLVWTRIAPAQAPPAPPPPQVIPGDVMTITVPEVLVRSGPSESFYPTSKLYVGDKVEVVSKSDKANAGWLTIKPPRGSQSWINARFVRQTGPNTGVVTTADDVPVPVKPASSLVEQEPNVESCKVARGTLLVIVGREKYGANAAWWPIEPPPSDVRYIPESAVAKSNPGQPANTSGFVPPPGGSQSVLDQAEAKMREAQQLYQLAAQSSDPNQRAQAMGKLQSLQQGSPAGAVQQPGYPNNNAVDPPKVTLGGNAVASQTTSTSSSSTTQVAAAQWSKWGTLRKTAFKLSDGQPMFRLEDDRGSPLGYAVAAPGLTLDPYVGRLACVYGPTAYRSDDALRTNYTIVSNISLSDR